MKKKIVGIYKITSPIGRIYIGQSVNIKRRFQEYARLNCLNQPRLCNSFIKYGIFNHKMEIIAECESNDLNTLERYYQDLYCCLGRNGLNCILTNNGDSKKIISQETRNKISKSSIGKKISTETISKIVSSVAKTRALTGFKSGPKKGYKLDERRKKILRDYWIGRRHTEDTKRKISETRLKMNIKLSDEIKAKINPTGRKHSEETKFKIGNSQKGKIIPLWQRERLSELKSSLVIDLQTGIFYKSIKEAAFFNCIEKGGLAKRLNGDIKNKTSLRYA